MPILKVTDLQVAYGMIEAVRGISFEVNEGEIVTLIGSNGAGKTTTLRAISHLEKVKSGTIEFLGENITSKPPHEIVKKGIAHVPEGRQVFPGLNVEDNLYMGALTRRSDTKGVAAELERVYEIFPRLKERRRQLAGTLSGGEQQMLAVGRAMMTGGKLMLLDEPSMGLAPMVVDEIFRTIELIRKEGMTVLLVEQNAFKSLKIANRAYILENGQITMEGTGKDLLSDPRVKEAYLGV
ncbi:MAG TPA: ABC transporter ATP-binding protein [Firmicutes bacterium]|nr:ABC transporter ATP-binding protein [Bacillota bacterium]